MIVTKILESNKNEELERMVSSFLSDIDLKNIIHISYAMMSHGVSVRSVMIIFNADPQETKLKETS